MRSWYVCHLLEILLTFSFYRSGTFCWFDIDLPTKAKLTCPIAETKNRKKTNNRETYFNWVKVTTTRALLFLNTFLILKFDRKYLHSHFDIGTHHQGTCQASLMHLFIIWTKKFWKSLVLEPFLSSLTLFFLMYF